MDLTTSYERVVPESIRERYDMREVRNAASVLAASNPDAFEEVMTVLDGFELTKDDIVVPGGSESKVAKRLNEAFRSRGWREARVDMGISLEARLLPYKPMGEKTPVVTKTDSSAVGYFADNMKGRVVLDVEWNAKDGNLDRDVAAYRALYDTGLIDGAIMVTRSFEAIRKLAIDLDRPGAFNTTTTTTIDKLEPRMKRGDGGGCPILAVAITDRCYKP